MGVSGQRHTPVTYYPRERTPGTHWIGDWVGLELVWIQRLEEKSFNALGDRTLVV
jgi:hypothetical protein